MYSIKHTVEQAPAQGASQQQRTPLPNIPSILVASQDNRLDRVIRILDAMRQKEEDEYEIFGKLVASKLQRYSAELCTSAQKAIMDIMYQADKQTDFELQFESSTESVALPSRPENFNYYYQPPSYFHLFPNLIPQPPSSTVTSSISEPSPNRGQNNSTSPTNSNSLLNKTWEIRLSIDT